MFTRIIIGLIIMGTGFLFVWKTDIPLRLIGMLPTAERWFIGGSRTMFKLIGLVIIFIGALVVVNLHGSFISGTLGWLIVGGR